MYVDGIYVVFMAICVPSVYLIYNLQIMSPYKNAIETLSRWNSLQSCTGAIHMCHVRHLHEQGFSWSLLQCAWLSLCSFCWIWRILLHFLCKTEPYKGKLEHFSMFISCVGSFIVFSLEQMVSLWWNKVPTKICIYWEMSCKEPYEEIEFQLWN